MSRPPRRSPAPSRLGAPESLQDLLLFRLWRITSRSSRVMNRICEREFGITRREWRVLAHLALGEGVLSSQLAERVELDRARTSRAISNLKDKRLVSRTPRPSDRREVVLHLTDAGRELYAALFPRAVQVNAELLTPFTAVEQAQLEQLLGRLHVQATRMAERITPAGDDESTEY